MLPDAGFARVRWRENDLGLAHNPASYKRYSKAIDAFLLFLSDGHGQLLEELTYHISRPAYVAQLRKQLIAAGFGVLKHGVVPDEDPNAVVAHFLPYDLSRIYQPRHRYAANRRRNQFREQGYAKSQAGESTPKAA